MLVSVALFKSSIARQAIKNLKLTLTHSVVTSFLKHRGYNLGS